jgi:hypothetical protein
VKIRTFILSFLGVCCSLAFAQVAPLAVSPSTGWPGWVWGLILLVVVCGATYLVLRKKDPAVAAKIDAAASQAIADAKALADKLHGHLETAQANTAAVIAKIPVTPIAPPPVSTQPVSPAAAPTPMDAPKNFVPPAETAPAPTTGANAMRDFNAEMPKMADWLNGTTNNWGVEQTPPAHPEIPGAFQKYFTTMEDLWQKNPDWGVGPASYELALQAAIKAVPNAVVNPPVIPTADVLQKGLFYNGLANDADKIGYLKLPGNNGLIDYLNSLSPSFQAWFMKADYQTDSGANDPITGQPMPKPRPWE